MRIVVVANHDPTDVRNWSGTPYRAWLALSAGEPGAVLVNTPWVDRLLHLLNKITIRLGVDVFRFQAVTRFYGARLDRRLRAADCETLISIGATHKICDLKWSGPVLHVTDALYATVLANYPRYGALRPWSKRRGDAVQRRALARIHTVYLSSERAASDARASYPEYAAKMRHLSFGANIDDPGMRYRRSGHLKLLFVGTDWKRKGGERVVSVFRHLRESNPDCELAIVGCRPPLLAEDGIRIYGRLNKDDPSQAVTLTKLLREAAFLMVLSQSEAFGIVFCEAAAHGLPVIASNIGGIPDIVVNDQTGLLFDAEKTSAQIAESVDRLWHDRARYEAMSEAARLRFERSLNWDAWSRRILSEAGKARTALVARYPSECSNPQLRCDSSSARPSSRTAM